jgi:hypothetical protein
MSAAKQTRASPTLTTTEFPEDFINLKIIAPLRMPTTSSCWLIPVTSIAATRPADLADIAYRVEIKNDLEVRFTLLR